MNKKYYHFLILIFILIILLYNIINHKYEQFKIKNYITSIEKLNQDIGNNIIKAKEIIEYKKSKAYKNKILKQDKWLKNKAEKIVYITTEEKYNKYIQEIKNNDTIQNSKNSKEIDETYWMTNFEKWLWFIFKIDTR